MNAHYLFIYLFIYYCIQSTPIKFLTSSFSQVVHRIHGWMAGKLRAYSSKDTGCPSHNTWMMNCKQQKLYFLMQIAFAFACFLKKLDFFAIARSPFPFGKTLSINKPVARTVDLSEFLALVDI